MPSPTESSNTEYEASYWGARDAISSLSRRIFFGILMLLVGIFGLGLLSAAVIPIVDGDATRAAYPALVVGFLLAIFAAYELYSL